MCNKIVKYKIILIITEEKTKIFGNSLFLGGKWNDDNVMVIYLCFGIANNIKLFYYFFVFFSSKWGYVRSITRLPIANQTKLYSLHDR